MDEWFFNWFVGSSIPITYTQMITAEDIFTGEKQTIFQKDRIGMVHTKDLQKFMDDMKKIQDEIKI